MLSTAASLALAVWGGALAARGAAPTGEHPVVQVVLDMDAWTPGYQHSIHVPEGTTHVACLAVYIFDPLEERPVRRIGYFGAINRGIALGHMPSDANYGVLTDMTGAVGSPVNPGSVAYLSFPPALDPAFLGPEVQYVEGATETAIIPAVPTAPIFSADVTLEGAVAGDVYDLYLLDFISVWMWYFLEEHFGAFSTGPHVSMDTGGDHVPDETSTIYGIDPDLPVPVPPGAYEVDFVDGPPAGGPATIRIVPIGDLDGDGIVGVNDFLLLLAAWGPCPDPPEPCRADLDGDGSVGVNDFLMMLGSWGM
jgi:hypothetical protein